MALDQTQIGATLEQRMATGGPAGASINQAALDQLRRLGKKEGNTIRSDGRGGLTVENKSGQVVFNVPAAQMGDAEQAYEQLRDLIKEGEIGGMVGIREDGSLYVDMSPVGTSREPPGDLREDATTSSENTGSAQGGGGRGGSGGSGGRGGGGGGGRGGGGGGGSPGGAGGGGAGGSIGTGNLPSRPTFGGDGDVGTAPPPIGGGGGDSRIDPNAPIGINDPGRANVNLGDFFQGGEGAIASLPSIFDQLPENPTLKDIIGAVTRRQEAGLDAQLDIFGGLFNDALNSPEAQGERDLINRIFDNPESLTPEIVSQIKGRQNAAIGSRASQLSQLAGDRAASRGVGRDVGTREQSRILRDAAAQQTAGERDIDITAARQNFQDRLNALRGAGGAARAQRGERRDIGGAAAGAIGANQVVGDAFLTNALLSKPETPKLAPHIGGQFTTPRFVGGGLRL